MKSWKWAWCQRWHLKVGVVMQWSQWSSLPPWPVSGPAQWPLASPSCRWAWRWSWGRPGGQSGGDTRHSGHSAQSFSARRIPTTRSQRAFWQKRKHTLWNPPLTCNCFHNSTHFCLSPQQGVKLVNSFILFSKEVNIIIWLFFSFYIQKLYKSEFFLWHWFFGLRGLDTHNYETAQLKNKTWLAHTSYSCATFLFFF